MYCFVAAIGNSPDVPLKTIHINVSHRDYSSYVAGVYLMMISLFVFVPLLVGECLVFKVNHKLAKKYKNVQFTDYIDVL